MSKFKSVFRAIQSGLKYALEEHKRLTNRLNYWDKIHDKVFDEFVTPIIESDLPAEKRERSGTLAMVVMFLCTFDRAHLWRVDPKKGRKSTPKKEVKAKETLLGLDDLEKLEEGKGISMHTLFLRAYGIAKIAWDKYDLTKANIANISDEDWLQWGYEYNQARIDKRKKRQAKKEAKVEEVEVDETQPLSELSVNEILEELEKDSSRVKELTDAEKATAVRVHADEAEASRGVKGILTKQINSLS